MTEIESRLAALEEKVKSLSSPGLMNFSQAADYIGTSSAWIKFLIENNLLKVTYLPQYRKARIARIHLDELIDRLTNRSFNDKSLLVAFVKANTITNNRYKKFKERK